MSAQKRVRAKAASSWYGKTKKVLGSELFFRLTLALFVLQAGIIAIVSGYPLAFDEGYHLGIIQLHATQLSPFFSNLPDSTGQFGSLLTDPSYLYHYVMSFPYRFITNVTTNGFFVVLFLRFFSIAFFATGIILFRKVLKFTGASKALINLVLLAFVALPLESFTAAQINYDNLLFPATAAALLFCLRFTEKLRTTKQFDATNFVLTASLCLLAAQVKYVFIPIFVAIAAFVAYNIGRWIYKERRKAFINIKRNTAALSNHTKFLLVALTLVSVGLFAYRFGYNLVKYQAVAPDCSKVLSVESCMQYGPWARNYELGKAHTPHTSWEQRESFIKTWISINVGQLLTVIDGNKGGSTVRPVDGFVKGVYLIIAIGVVFLILQWRKVREIDHATGLIVLVSAAYVTAVLLRNYSEYTRYGMPIAIQGRYLLPIIILLLIVLAQAYSTTLKSKPNLKMLVLALVAMMSLQGGGVITYALRANDESWRWTTTAVVPTHDLTSAQASQAAIR